MMLLESLNTSLPIQMGRQKQQMLLDLFSPHQKGSYLPELLTAILQVYI